MTNPGNPNFKPPTLRLPKAPQPTKNDQVRAIVDITLSFMQKHLHKNGNVYLVNTATRQVFFIDEDSVFNTIADVALHERDIVISNSAIQMAK